MKDIFKSQMYEKRILEYMLLLNIYLFQNISWQIFMK